MSNGREPSKRMTEKFIREYPEYVGYYFQESPKGKCACCGYSNLIERHEVRSPISGDVVEIGWICYGYWCEIKGYGHPDPRFAAYKAQKGVARREIRRSLIPKLKEWGRKHPGKKLPAEEVQKMIKKAEEMQRIEEMKRKGLKRQDFSYSEFGSLKIAQEFAEKHGGYAPENNPITIRGVKKWILYLPEGNIAYTIPIVRISVEEAERLSEDAQKEGGTYG